MLSFVLLLIGCAALARSQNGEIVIPDNKTLCMSDMIEWCNNMKYPQQSAGLGILSIVYEDPNGYYRVFCSSDTDGTNCTRNRSPWFTCSPDHVLTYKGQVLSNETSKDDVDDDICATADKAFNELYVQNLSYKNMSLQNEVQKGMEAFFDQIAMMGEQIELIKRFIRAIPYIGNLFSIMDEEEEAVDRVYDYPTTALNNRNQASTDQLYHSLIEQTDETNTYQMNQTVPNKINRTISDQMHQAVPDQMHQVIPDQMNQSVSDKMHQAIPDQMHQGIPDQTHQAIPDQMNQGISDQRNQAVPNPMNQAISYQINQRVPDQSTADEMDQDTTDQMNQIETE